MIEAAARRNEPVPPPPPHPSHRLDTLQGLRAFAALSVVWYHVVVTWYDGGHHPAVGLFHIGGIGVDCFFCLSGFIIGWIHRSDIGSPSLARSFALKRFIRIYPPYILLLTFTTVLLFATGRMTYSPWHILQSFLLLPPALPDDFVVGVAWTLVYEAFFYLLFFGAILSGKRMARIGVAVWIAGIFLHPLLHFAGSSSAVCDFVLSPFHLEFLGGIAAAGWAAKEAGTQWISGRSGVLGTAALALLALDIGFGGIRTALPFDPSLPQRLFLSLCFSTILFALVRLEIEGRIFVPRFLVLLGGASYSIYLVHFETIKILGALSRHWIEFLLGLPGGRTLCALTATLAGIGAGTLYHLTVEKPLLEWGRKRISIERKK